MGFIAHWCVVTTIVATGTTVEFPWDLVDVSVPGDVVCHVMVVGVFAAFCDGVPHKVLCGGSCWTGRVLCVWDEFGCVEVW